jgi:hypothetical protein
MQPKVPKRLLKRMNSAFIGYLMSRKKAVRPRLTNSQGFVLGGNPT